MQTFDNLTKMLMNKYNCTSINFSFTFKLQILYEGTKKDQQKNLKRLEFGIIMHTSQICSTLICFFGYINVIEAGC